MPATEDDKVVRVVDETSTVGLVLAALSPRPQEPMHVDVCQQRTEHSSLRSAAPAMLATRHAPPPLLIPFLDRRFQPHLNESQHCAIDHASSDTLHQLLVRDGVEILRQVRVDDLRIAVAQSPMHRLDRVPSTPARAIAVRTRVELRFEDRFQYE